MQAMCNVPPRLPATAPSSALLARYSKLSMPLNDSALHIGVLCSLLRMLGFVLTLTRISAIDTEVSELMRFSALKPSWQ